MQGARAAVELSAVRISPSTALCGIVLHPASHTRSPAMHNAAYAALGIDALFVAFDVPGERLGPAIAGARALGVRQLAVSLPHKQTVMAHLDEIDETARRIGAVNTVTLRAGRLLGSNTDWLGVRARSARRSSPGGGRWCSERADRTRRRVRARRARPRSRC
jgi:shikimate dehydrogenase